MTAREFTELVMPLGDRLYRVAWYILEDKAEAEDAVQDLYVKLWNSRDTLDHVRNTDAYCITLLKNICIDRIRKASRMPSGELSENLQGSDDIGKAVAGREELSGVMGAFEKLSEGQRKVLEMKVFEELDYEEMAERTGMSKLTLRVLLSQARSKLKKAYYEKY